VVTAQHSHAAQRHGGQRPEVRRREKPNNPLELTARSAGCCGYSWSWWLWAAAQRERSVPEAQRHEPYVTVLDMSVTWAGLPPRLEGGGPR
jgi:hypothetical protein